MTITVRSITTLAMFLWLMFPSASKGAELDKHLQFLKPLIGLNWEGGFIGDNAPDLAITLNFEPVLAGKAVKYSRTAAEIGFFSETHFYWSPNRDEVLFISLNSRGIVSEGVAHSRDGGIVLFGDSHRPEKSTEFKTVLHIGSNGVLRDTFTRKKNGAWVPGHQQEFTARE